MGAAFSLARLASGSWRPTGATAARSNHYL
jgi:hypothetical protein